MVFDSSAEFGGTPLNKELLPGPDLANSLIGVLFRFCHREVGIMADIEQMFHCFHVNLENRYSENRDLLRFLYTVRLQRPQKDNHRVSHDRSPIWYYYSTNCHYAHIW